MRKLLTLQNTRKPQVDFVRRKNSEKKLISIECCVKMELKNLSIYFTANEKIVDFKEPTEDLENRIANTKKRYSQNY